LHRQFREILNPYLTPTAVLAHESGVRDVAAKLLDEFIATGSDDFVNLVTRPYAPALAFKFLLGVDETELELATAFVHECLYEGHRKDTSAAEKAWHDWNKRILDERRHSTRRHDLIDGILHGTIDNGRPLSETEQIGALNILMRGGFTTTADASSNLLVRLAEDPTLQERLRAEPTLIPKAIDEGLRIDPPVTALGRVCADTTTFDSTVVPSGERVLFNMAAANRDPTEFVDPDQFILDRKPNRHLAFGGGIHRCIGLHFARLTVRVLFEEILLRMTDIRLTPGKPVQRSSSPGQYYIPDSVSITYQRTQPR
jgi:cytochrome P450